jgi:RHS repeat-associated protein
MLTDGANPPVNIRRYDYEPYGRQILAGTNGRSAAMGYLGLADSLGAEYIGETRDGETMLDFFNARYFAAAQGRFQSPDPGNAGASLANPQTWNGYAYVGNSPLTFTDPSGMFLPVVPAPVFEGAKDGATLCGPTCAAIGAGVGAAVELGYLLWDIFGGGGPAHAVGSLAAGGLGNGSFASGNLYGDGNTSPFVFSLAQAAGDDEDVYSIPGLLFFAQATGSMPKTGTPKRPTFQVRFLPNNAQKCTAMGQQFYAPPQFSIKTIVTAGEAGGMFNVSAMGNAVGHYGTFDFQRVRDSAGNTIFYSGYTPVSNVAVGAYTYGADFTKNGALAIAKTFKLFVAGNKGAASAPFFTGLGWDLAAGKGSASCSPIP